MRHTKNITVNQTIRSIHQILSGNLPQKDDHNVAEPRHKFY